jgi:hypothetical protein
MDIVEAARLYRSKGFAIVWLNPGEKFLRTAGWSTRSQEPEDYVAGRNLGLLTGWLSGNLMCADIDGKMALELADGFLPETGMVDGRPGKPRSHRWYIVTGIPEGMTSHAEQAAPAAVAAGVHAGPFTKHLANVYTRKNILDFLGTGAFATAPPSIVSGEQRAWEGGLGEPAVVPMEELYEAVCNLAVACGWSPSERVQRAAEKLAKVSAAVSGKGGRLRAYEAARNLTNDFELSREETKLLIREWNRGNVPPFTERELMETVDNSIANGADPRFPRGRGNRPQIQHQIDIAVTLDQAVYALRNEGRLYQRSGQLVHVVESGGGLEDGIYRPSGSPRIVPVIEGFLRELLTTNAVFVNYVKKEGETEGQTKVVPPHKSVMEGILARCQWSGIRDLRSVVEVPVLLPDGTVLSEPEYHPRSGLLYAPDGCTVAVGESREDARKAAGRRHPPPDPPRAVRQQAGVPRGPDRLQGEEARPARQRMPGRAPFGVAHDPEGVLRGGAAGHGAPALGELRGVVGAGEERDRVDGVPYALHRQNGTVPAVRRLSCQVATTDHGGGHGHIALAHFCICSSPHRRKSVFDHFRKWCYTEKRNSA